MNRLLLMLGAAALAAAAFGGASAQSGMTLTIAVGDDYGPWVDRELPHGGYATRLVELAAERAGAKVTETIWVPWKRAFEITRTAEADVTMPWIRTPERETEFLFTDPIVTLSDFVYFRADAPVETPEDMPGKRMCLPRGYSISGPVAGFIDSGAVQRQSPADMASCFKLLDAGRVDFIVAASTEAPVAIEAAGLPTARFGQSAKPHAEQQLSIIASKGNPKGAAIIALLNEGIAAMEADGTAQALRAQYP